MMRTLCSNKPILMDMGKIDFKENLAEQVIFCMLSIMVFAALAALVAISELGDNYRMLFFTEQNDIFGYERFGFFFQIITEYGALALFSVVLTRSKDLKWRMYLIIWAILGTITTLGRWYAFYAFLLFVLTKKTMTQSNSFFNILLYIALALTSIMGGSLIFVCRGGECAFDIKTVIHGFTAGIGSYFYIPIEMVHKYYYNEDYGVNLFIGFLVYPIEIIGRTTGLYTIAYEYDDWALVVQNYVNLPNMGSYNALVGQPLTSFIAAGYFGLFFHYCLIGALSGVCYSNSNEKHPLAVVSLIVATASFFMPVLSGPMFVTSILSLFIFQNILNGGGVLKEMVV